MTGNFGPLNMSYADQKFCHCISMGIKQPSAQVQTSNKVLNVTENKNAQMLSVLTNFLFKSKIIHVCLFFFLYCSLKKLQFGKHYLLDSLFA